MKSSLGKGYVLITDIYHLSSKLANLLSSHSGMRVARKETPQSMKSKNLNRGIKDALSTCLAL